MGSFLRRYIVTNFKFEWLVSIMNSFNMLFHGTLLRSIIVTNLTFERLISFMNWCNTLLRTTICMYKFHILIFTYFHNNKKFGSGRKIWAIWYRDESLRCVCALRIVAIIHGIFCQDWPWRQEMQLTSVASINSKRQHLKSCHSIYIRTVSS